MSLEVTKVEIEYLKKQNDVLERKIEKLTEAVDALTEQLIELRLGRKWLWGLLSAAALVGALADTIARFLKVY